MITFLPFADFDKCAQVLDMQRLGKQRSEAKWALERVLGIKKYFNHSLLRMWKPWPCALVDYGVAICDEWQLRGYKDTLLDYFLDYKESGEYEYQIPSWILNEKLFSSHRSRLITKNPQWYSQFNWIEKPDESIGYFWPL